MKTSQIILIFCLIQTLILSFYGGLAGVIGWLVLLLLAYLGIVAIEVIETSKGSEPE